MQLQQVVQNQAVEIGRDSELRSGRAATYHNRRVCVSLTLLHWGYFMEG